MQNYVCPIKSNNFNKDLHLTYLYLQKKNITLLSEHKSKVRGCDVTIKILEYCNENEGDFVYINDDFIIERLPEKPIFNGELKDNPTYNTSYRLAIENTLDLLKAHGKTTYNFETHTPIIINCKLFRNLFNSLEIGDNNHFLKSIYLNWYGIEGQPGENVKIRVWSQHRAENLFQKYGCISLSDDTPDRAYEWLRKRIDFRQP
jgi:hypothetical protein